MALGQRACSRCAGDITAGRRMRALLESAELSVRALASVGDRRTRRRACRKVASGNGERRPRAAGGRSQATFQEAAALRHARGRTSPRSAALRRGAATTSRGGELDRRTRTVQPVLPTVALDAHCGIAASRAGRGASPERGRDGDGPGSGRPREIGVALRACGAGRRRLHGRRCCARRSRCWRAPTHRLEQARALADLAVTPASRGPPSRGP